MTRGAMTRGAQRRAEIGALLASLQRRPDVQPSLFVSQANFYRKLAPQRELSPNSRHASRTRGGERRSLSPLNRTSKQRSPTREQVVRRAQTAPGKQRQVGVAPSSRNKVQLPPLEDSELAVVEAPEFTEAEAVDVEEEEHAPTLEECQAAWLRWVALAQRQVLLAQALEKIKARQRGSSASTIQRGFRRGRERKWDKKHKDVSSPILRKYAWKFRLNYRCRRRQRANRLVAGYLCAAACARLYNVQACAATDAVAAMGIFREYTRAEHEVEMMLNPIGDIAAVANPTRNSDPIVSTRQSLIAGPSQADTSHQAPAFDPALAKKWADAIAVGRIESQRLTTQWNNTHNKVQLLLNEGDNEEDVTGNASAKADVSSFVNGPTKGKKGRRGNKSDRPPKFVPRKIRSTLIKKWLLESRREFSAQAYEAFSERLMLHSSGALGKLDIEDMRRLMGGKVTIGALLAQKTKENRPRWDMFMLYKSARKDGRTMRDVYREGVVQMLTEEHERRNRIDPEQQERLSRLELELGSARNSRDSFFGGSQSGRESGYFASTPRFSTFY